MPTLHIRLNDHYYSALKTFGAQRGMKTSEAVRHLLDKELFTTPEQTLQSAKQETSVSHFDRKIGEYIAESLVLIRNLIQHSLNDDMDMAKQTISDAAVKARNHIKKILADN